MLESLVFIIVAFPGVAIFLALFIVFIFAVFYAERRNNMSDFSRITTLFTISVWTIYLLYQTGKLFWMKKATAPFYLDLFLLSFLFLITIVGFIGLIDKGFKSLFILATLSISIAVIVEIWPEPKCSGRGGRSYCSPCEQDAKNVIAALASYFSEPENMRMPKVEVLIYDRDLSLNNPVENVILFPEPGELAQPQAISVMVIDDTDCCPRGSSYVRTMGGDIGYWK